MSSLQELIALKENLEREIADLTNQNRAKAIAEIRVLMDENALTVSDLNRGGGSATRTKAQTNSLSGTKLKAKFRDQSTGQEWSGRGLRPRWLTAALAEGKAMTDFAVA